MLLCRQCEAHKVVVTLSPTSRFSNACTELSSFSINISLTFQVHIFRREIQTSMTCKS